MAIHLVRKLADQRTDSYEVWDMPGHLQLLVRAANSAQDAMEQLQGLPRFANTEDERRQFMALEVEAWRLLQLIEAVGAPYLAEYDAR